MENTTQLRIALTAMRNLGVALNEHDSNALDVLCEYVDAALARESSPVQQAEPVAWNLLKNGAPESGRLVWCLREWIPQHVGSDGRPRREVVLAARKSSAPPTYHEDISRNDWWHGEGATWSDGTVLAWAEAVPPPYESIAATPPAAQPITDEPTGEELRALNICQKNDGHTHAFSKPGTVDLCRWCNLSEREWRAQAAATIMAARPSKQPLTAEQILDLAMHSNLGVVQQGLWIAFRSHKEWVLKFARSILSQSPAPVSEKSLIRTLRMISNLCIENKYESHEALKSLVEDIETMARNSIAIQAREEGGT